MSRTFVWADVTNLITDIRATIALRESLPAKYLNTNALYAEMTREIDIQADTVAHMIKVIANQPDEPDEDDIPF